MSIIERLTTIFAPDDCLSCGREGSLLCAICRPQLPVLAQRCFGCRLPVAGAGCNKCLAFIGLRALHVRADYRDNAKLLVASLKFRGNQSAARLMAHCLANSTSLPHGALLVHIPATTAHIRQRGFDQSALIARQLSRLTGRPYVNALRRTGQQHQLGAGRTQRLQQLSCSLSVRSSVVFGKHVILIDDVLTTGSTLQAAARVLRAAGALQVDAVVFAQSTKSVDAK